MNPLTLPCWCLVDAAGNVPPHQDGLPTPAICLDADFARRKAAERPGCRVVEAVATVEALDVPAFVEAR